METSKISFSNLPDDIKSNIKTYESNDSKLLKASYDIDSYIKAINDKKNSLYYRVSLISIIAIKEIKPVILSREQKVRMVVSLYKEENLTFTVDNFKTLEDLETHMNLSNYIILNETNASTITRYDDTKKYIVMKDQNVIPKIQIFRSRLLYLEYGNNLTEKVKNNNLRDISIFGNVKHIGDNFLHECTNLEKVDYTGLTTLETVGNNWMADSKLSYINLEGLINLKTVGNNWMSNCYRLDSFGLRLARTGVENSKTVRLKGSLPSLTSVGNNWLANCLMLRDVNFRASGSELGLPSLTTIGENFLGGNPASPATSFNFDELPSLRRVGNSSNIKVQTERERLRERLVEISDGRSKRKSKKSKSKRKSKRKNRSKSKSKSKRKSRSKRKMI
jgi:hypothetical protein